MADSEKSISPFKDPRRKHADTLAAEAERRQRRTRVQFAEAAKLEEAVMAETEGLPKTRGLLARSAAWRWMHAGKPEEALRLAKSEIARPSTPLGPMSELVEIRNRAEALIRLGPPAAPPNKGAWTRERDELPQSDAQREG